MDITRITARWTGFPGAPGYSNFYFSAGWFDGGLFREEAEMLATRVRNAFGGISAALPSSVRIEIEPEAVVLDSDTGMASEFINIDTPSVVEGQNNADFAGPVGAVVTWRTDDLRNGRRIRGRTFLVPLASVVFEADGTLDATWRERINDFADELRGGVTDGDLGVWSRPVGGSGGVFATVTGHTVPDMAAVLRSRRD